MQTLRKIEAFEVIDHGIDHEQYFPGCGVSLTEFTDCATGIGDDAAEAFDDALESLAQDGFDVESIGPDECPESSESVSKLMANADEHESYDSHHYYVSIRVR